ncbi:ATP-binding protein [Actinomadura sp. DC4]|uniref:ATP-binding protein n=1 Tax=Actinomadura sp. DC4 TaxID=3055069 RepID=UPI0025AEF201|nr:ATP-binding protein [Actinomadura sp. DC4]MDN3351944.1 ATP-binding protein [Actinomadura sp. DC4]
MSTVFVAVPRAAGEARAFTASVLKAWDLPHLVETAELLVSELITNTVKHAGGVMEPPDDLSDIPRVILSVSRSDALLVEVWDAGTEPAVLRTAAADDVDGRGLDLVDALSKEWGGELLETGGKVVWFVIDLDVRDEG